MILDLQTPTGAIKSIGISKLSAFDGWNLQEKFVRFVLTDSKEFKRAFTFEVLSHAKVLQKDGGSLPLSTDALVHNHLGSWENVRDVFEIVLKHNGIDPKTHVEPHFWAKAGEDMASSFLARIFEEPIVQELMKNGRHQG